MSRVEIADRYIDKASQAAPQALLLFDTVDLHYVREQRLAHLESSKTLHRLAEQRRQQEIAVVKKSDVTLVVSPVERDTIKEDAPDVVVEIVSNIHEVNGSLTPFAKRSGILFVGGFFHKPNTDAVIFFVNDILPLVRKSLPEALFYIVGANPTQEVHALESKGVIVTGHVSDISDYFNRCRVSVAPLRYGAGVKGKVNMSLSYGLPVVATSVAVEGMYLTNGMNVLIADEPRSFAQALTRLYGDEVLWERLSCNGLSNVSEHFSVAAAKQALERVLSFRPAPT
jgi:O-antigen biosynthesis protein